MTTPHRITATPPGPAAIVEGIRYAQAAMTTYREHCRPCERDNLPRMLADLLHAIALTDDPAEVFGDALRLYADDLIARDFPARLPAEDQEQKEDDRFLEIAGPFTAALLIRADTIGAGGVLSLLTLALSPHQP
jgi:hypothetical protein